MLTSDQKGAVAETAIIHAAIKLGISVYTPVAEGGRYDMIFELGERLVRVQCKWAPRHGDVIVVRCYSSRRNRDGLLRRLYSADEIDAFAAYCADLDRCYFLPARNLRRTKRNPASSRPSAEQSEGRPELGEGLRIRR